VNAIDNSAAYSIGTSDGAISGSSHSSIVEQAFIEILSAAADVGPTRTGFSADGRIRQYSNASILTSVHDA
jgi:hypothetical protein